MFALHYFLLLSLIDFVFHIRIDSLLLLHLYLDLSIQPDFQLLSMNFLVYFVLLQNQYLLHNNLVLNQNYYLLKY
ncbi:MAG: hypothetical protein EBZ69_01895 [Alphaproteobacteria bacterium]|nr:hypothetical protein [Alphaproteobacteria bacterium]